MAKLGNGRVERMNKVILSAINASTDDEDRWDDCIGRVQWGVNTTVNSTTGKSLYEILMGYKPRVINNAYLVHELCDEENPQDIMEVRAKVAERIKEKQQNVSATKYQDSFLSAKILDYDCYVVENKFNVIRSQI